MEGGPPCVRGPRPGSIAGWGCSDLCCTGLGAAVAGLIGWCVGSGDGRREREGRKFVGVGQGWMRVVVALEACLCRRSER